MENKEWTAEELEVLNSVAKYIDTTAAVFGKPERGVINIEKREPMYGGNGVVYMLSLFEKDELVNNRIGCYMVLMDNGDQAGFHEHGSKKEQELYIIVNGEGRYIERIREDQVIKETILRKGAITAIKGDNNYHSIINIGEEPLIIFVVTTYEK